MAMRANTSQQVSVMRAMPRIATATVHSAVECDSGLRSAAAAAASSAAGMSSTEVAAAMSSAGEGTAGSGQQLPPQYGNLKDPRYSTARGGKREPTRPTMRTRPRGNGGASGSLVPGAMGSLDKRRVTGRQQKESSGEVVEGSSRQKTKELSEDAVEGSSVPSEPWHSAAVEGWDAHVESCLREVFPLFDLDQDGLLDRADHGLILAIAEQQGCARNAFLFHRFAGGSEAIDVEAFITGVQAAWQLQKFGIADLVKALRKGPMVRRPQGRSRHHRERLEKEKAEKKGKEEAAKETGKSDGGKEGLPAPDAAESPHEPTGKEARAEDAAKQAPGKGPPAPQRPSSSDRPGSETKRKPPKPPPEIEERYQIGTLLGKGGFAEVYRAALKTTPGAEHALKVVDVREERGGLPRAMAVREAEIMLDANHKGIVKVYDCFHSETTSHVWIAMELMRGGSLQSYVQEHGKFEEKTAVSVFVQLLEAIDYLHNAMEVVHRDLKPDNILLSDAAEMVAKIGDFGLSTSYKSTRAMNLYCGTPQFAAPELVLSKGYSRAVDLWSAGVILFYMICGRRPFSGEKKELEAQICAATYSFEQSAISPAAKDLISRLLKVEPLQRYSVKESLAHPWSKAETEITKGSLPLSVFEMLRIKTRTKSMLEAGLQSPEASPSPVTPNMGTSPPAGIDIFTTSQLLEKTELPERPELKLNRNNSYSAIPQARPTAPGPAPKYAAVAEKPKSPGPMEWAPRPAPKGFARAVGPR